MNFQYQNVQYRDNDSDLPPRHLLDEYEAHYTDEKRRIDFDEREVNEKIMICADLRPDESTKHLAEADIYIQVIDASLISYARSRMRLTTWKINNDRPPGSLGDL